MPGVVSAGNPARSCTGPHTHQYESGLTASNQSLRSIGPGGARQWSNSGTGPELCRIRDRYLHEIR